MTEQLAWKQSLQDSCEILRQSYRQEHNRLVYQQARKGFIYFGTFLFTDISAITCITVYVKTYPSPPPKVLLELVPPQSSLSEALNCTFRNITSALLCISLKIPTYRNSFLLIYNFNETRIVYSFYDVLTGQDISMLSILPVHRAIQGQGSKKLFSCHFLKLN